MNPKPKSPSVYDAVVQTNLCGYFFLYERKKVTKAADLDSVSERQKKLKCKKIVQTSKV